MMLQSIIMGTQIYSKQRMGLILFWKQFKCSMSLNEIHLQKQLHAIHGWIA